jgi:hypothetical protein
MLARRKSDANMHVFLYIFLFYFTSFVFSFQLFLLILKELIFEINHQKHQQQTQKHQSPSSQIISHKSQGNCTARATCLSPPEN